MSPVEIAIRAVCKDMGANPEEWRGFLAVALIGLNAFADALPAEVRDLIRPYLETPT